MLKSLKLLISLKIKLKRKERLNSTRLVLAGEFINKDLLVESTDTSNRIIIKSSYKSHIRKYTKLLEANY